MLYKHKFNRHRICEICGMTVREAASVRSKLCGICDCTRDEWNQMQVTHLITYLEDQPDGQA